MRPELLVVDYDGARAATLADLLIGRGFGVRIAVDAVTAIASFSKARPALVLGELDMPGLDGLELCRHVRASSSTPIVMLSHDRSETAEVAALDAGADDFIVRPLRPDTLVARIRVALRRGGVVPEASVIGVGQFQIDFDARRVRVHGQAVRLTPKEFDLFTYMARHPNRVLAHRTLLSAVWGNASEEQSEYLRVFVGQLRKKMEDNPSRPRYLLTEPWVGYRFNPNGDAPQ
jgi:two-component system KDP operon response regulator KdpE